MSHNNSASLLDELLREKRDKRNRDQLANEILGKNRHSKAQASVQPRASSLLSASLASRVGVSKRTSSLPRSGNGPARNTPLPLIDRTDSRKTKRIQPSSSSDLVMDPEEGEPGQLGAATSNGGSGLSIRGAAGGVTGGPHVVIASNFEDGTTEADIESVMLDVGSSLTGCRILSYKPSIVAELTFDNKADAEAVIAKFNNQKLYLVGQASTGVNRRHVLGLPRPLTEPAPTPAAAVTPPDDTMEVDETAISREAEDRHREERRRARPENDRFPRGSFSSGGGGRGFDENYYRRAGPNYYGGGYDYRGRDRGGRYGGRDGGYRNADGSNWRM